jgi:hypothetical protein
MCYFLTTLSKIATPSQGWNRKVDDDYIRFNKYRKSRVHLITFTVQQMDEIFSKTCYWITQEGTK